MLGLSVSGRYPCPLAPCPRGQALDVAGCRCVPITRYPPSQTRNLRCPNVFCPFALFPCASYKIDTRGCRTCDCQCPSPICPRRCPYGTETSVDRRGCKICKCATGRTSSVCPFRPCGAFCPNGLQTDENGCQLCKCKPKRCGSLCRNLCPAGRVLDADGCPTCKCKWR